MSSGFQTGKLSLLTMNSEEPIVCMKAALSYLPLWPENTAMQMKV